MTKFLGTVLAIILAAIFTISIVSHANGFARTGGEVASFPFTTFLFRADMANNQNWGDLFEGCPSRSYKGISFTIGEQLERSVKFSCAKVIKDKSRIGWDKARDEVIDGHNPFFPEIPDLEQTVRVKLLAARPRVEAIWRDPDEEQGGVRGISKFVLAIADNAATDFYRYQRRHNGPELLAARLDEPITVQVDGEDEEITLADTIPDSDGVQAFQFEDLRTELTDEEFQVLQGRVQGATQAELAQETNASTDAIARTYARAKSKTRKWVNGLKQQTYHQTRARMCPRFSRHRCVRPDRLRGVELEAWNPANNRNVVEFHDESREWRPPITNKPRVRAERECFNDACTQGGAVGPDNLVLPSAQATSGKCGDFRNAKKQSGDFRTLHGVTWLQPQVQVVRYLPAITGQKNRPCEGCEAAKRAERAPMRETAKPTTEITTANDKTHERMELSDLRVVRILLDGTTMNNINGDANAA